MQLMLHLTRFPSLKRPAQDAALKSNETFDSWAEEVNEEGKNIARI
jgi:hypothetical protein